MGMTHSLTTCVNGVICCVRRPIWWKLTYCVAASGHPLEEPVPLAPYYVMVSRATHRPHVSVWPIALNARLPVLPIPLLEPDPDVMLDLGAVVASVYERGGYDARIDYRTPVPPPAHAEQEAVWVE